ncbi:MAG: hypothetical protein H0W28_07495 [Pyrinomonadaceae bacterium]|nr:hypothetical protein [Pyrinomonadaceae bacterium]
MPIIDAIIAVAAIVGWYLFWDWVVKVLWNVFGVSIVEMQRLMRGE